MTISKLPSGRWRAQVWHAQRWVPAATIIGGARSYPTKTDAKAAKRRAQERLETTAHRTVTVRQFAHTWTTDPIFARPKQSTNKHNAERVRRFVETHGNLPLNRVTDEIVAQWIAGGKNLSTVPALKAMFNDAASAKAGRVTTTTNPFAGLKLAKGKGRSQKTPPPEETVWQLIKAARAQAGPSLAAWLQVASHTGLRPGELDALRWDRVDFEHGRIHVVEQFNAKTRKFTTPKNDQTRQAIITPLARDALLAVPRDTDWCFTQLRGSHWTPSARSYHWKAVRAAVGYTDTLYLATRHYAGWYMTNVLLLPAEDVAIALGHTDGGYLVRTLYGHRDKDAALDRVAEAYARQGNVRPLRAVNKKESA